MQVPCSFFNQVVWFFLFATELSSLYILYIKSLSDVQFANISSHFIDGLFISLIVSFSLQKVFGLM